MQVTDRSFPSYLHRKFPYFDVCLPGSDILWWRFSKNSCSPFIRCLFSKFSDPYHLMNHRILLTSTTSFSEYNFFPPNTIRSGGSFSRFSSFFCFAFFLLLLPKPNASLTYEYQIQPYAHTHPDSPSSY